MSASDIAIADLAQGQTHLEFPPLNGAMGSSTVSLDNIGDHTEADLPVRKPDSCRHRAESHRESEEVISNARQLKLAERVRGNRLIG